MAYAAQLETPCTHCCLPALAATAPGLATQRHHAPASGSAPGSRPGAQLPLGDGPLSRSYRQLGPDLTRRKCTAVHCCLQAAYCNPAAIVAIHTTGGTVSALRLLLASFTYTYISRGPPNEGEKTGAPLVAVATTFCTAGEASSTRRRSRSRTPPRTSL